MCYSVSCFLGRVSHLMFVWKGGLSLEEEPSNSLSERAPPSSQGRAWKGVSAGVDQTSRPFPSPHSCVVIFLSQTVMLNILVQMIIVRFNLIY